MNTEQAMAACELERKRQIDSEGWTPEHDDTHDDGEMLRAAVIYWQNAARPDLPLQMGEDGAPIGWPWEAKWWKPKNRERDLVRAGALCLAESDRLERAGRRAEHVMHKYNQVIESLSQ